MAFKLRVADVVLRHIGPWSFSSESFCCAEASASGGISAQRLYSLRGPNKGLPPHEESSNTAAKLPCELDEVEGTAGTHREYSDCYLEISFSFHETPPRPLWVPHVPLGYKRLRPVTRDALAKLGECYCTNNGRCFC